MIQRPRSADVTAVAGVYDRLAYSYHLLFDDWWARARASAERIDLVLRSRGVLPRARLLDCACGIGTQSLPLAALGYDVVGVDVSGGSVQRAREESRKRGILARFEDIDIRNAQFAHEFDVAISVDNSLAHFDRNELPGSLTAIRRRLPAGAVFLASMRDYDALLNARPGGSSPRSIVSKGSFRIVGQGWVWAEDGSAVDVTLFVLEKRSAWQASLYEFRLYPHRRMEIERALEDAGFTQVAWHEPRDTGFYQPIVTGIAR
ncbi:MAG: class I SAM-dependent DNA methyltransferase [Sphingosinicella sp.]|uniref:class I SAM-dependent DNA methyltransferase n=1 Tax=Sphingosinicella sp. TaxID=1917971 RepID=UPI00403813A8